MTVANNVVNLIQGLRPVANEAMVESLRTILARAEAGEVQGGAFTLLTAGGSMETGWAGTVEHNIPHTLGGISVLNHRLILASVGK